MKRFFLNKITIYTVMFLLAFILIFKIFFKEHLSDEQFIYTYLAQGFLLFLLILIGIAKKWKS